MDARTVDSVLPKRSRRRAFVVLSAAVLLLHASALSGMNWVWPERPSMRVPVATIQVRTVVAVVEPAPAALPVTNDVPPAVPEAKAKPSMPVSRSRSAPALIAGGTLPTPAQTQMALLKPEAEAPSSEMSAVALAVAATEPVQAGAAMAASAPASTNATSDEKVPVYRTRIPPPLTLRYLLRKGLLSGTGELQWRATAEHYDLQMRGSVAGLTILTQTSAGGFDAAGLAPLRFTDQRLRRAVAAANFQREIGKITFSGPSAQFPVLPGEQDRLSWMVQLAAIAAGEQELLVPGGRLAMHVVGARADVGIWSFRFVANEKVGTRLGAVQAVKLIREPHDPYDTQAEVWLDPLRHFMPVRATLRNGTASGNDGEALDLILQEWVEPP